MSRRSGQPKQNKVDALRRQLLSSGRLYEDREFPPNNNSLNLNRREKVIWKRPGVSI